MPGPWRVRTRQPHGKVRVEFNDPLARNIAFFYYEVAGTTFYDAVTGNLAGTGAGQAANSQGGLTFSGTPKTSTTTAWQNQLGALDSSLTVVGCASLTTKPASKCAAINYGTTSRGAAIGFDSSGFATGMVNTSNGLRTFADSTDHTGGAPVVIGGSSDGTTGGVVKSWVNGVFIGSTNSGTNGTVTPTNVWMGHDGSSYNNNFTGNLYWAIGWNRLLSDAEHKEIAANPWQILESIPELGWLSLDAGGPPPTFNPGWAMGATRIISGGLFS